VTAAVAGVLYLSLGIVDHVNQAFFFTVSQDLMGFVLRDLTRQSFGYHKFRQFIVLEADFQAMPAVGAAKKAGGHTARAMGHGNFGGGFDNWPHLFIGHYALHGNV
jgi:hypothetical protein